MTTNKITELLESLTELNKKIKKRLKKEEGFNIFRALHKESDEVRLHSRFISVLLSPNSSHKSDVFLKKFIELFEIKDFVIDGVKIYPSELQKSEYKDIDILVINEKHKKAIIIENKIYAGDSNNEKGGQLERYIDLIHKNRNIALENILLFYLTLTGHDPSDESIGKYKNSGKVKLKTISYKTDIIQWLESCLTELSQDPFIAECINQYIKLLKDMTSTNKNQEEIKELCKIISSSNENLENAKLLHDSFDQIKQYIIKTFWQDLIDVFQQNAFHLEEESKNTLKNLSLTNNLEGLTFYFKFEDLLIYVEDGGEDSVHWGVVGNNNLKESYKEKLKDIGFKQANDYYFTFFEDKNEDNYVYFNNFSHQGTFNLINDEYRKKLIQGYVNEIKSIIESILVI